MVDKDQVVGVLRATLLSCKGAISLVQCNRDYKELEGQYIPYAKMGYSSLEAFVSEIPNIKLHKDSYGNVWVDAVPTEKTRHIAEMVAQQKSATKKSAPRLNYQTRIPKFDPWRRQPASSNYDKAQFYKQYNPYRAHNNNTSYSYNQNQHSKPYNQYKTPEPPRKQTPEARAAPPKKSSPPAPTPSQPVGTTNSTPKPNSVPKVNSVPKPNSAAKPPALTKTPVTERKSGGLSLSERMQAAVLADEAESSSPTSALALKSKHSKASNRLSNLRDRLQTDIIPLPLPATGLNNIFHQPEPVVEIVPPAPQLSPLPANATAQETLAWTCRKLALPEPVYKIDSVKDLKRGPAAFYCIVKVGNHKAMTYPDGSPSDDMSRELAAIKLQKELESLPSPVAPAPAVGAAPGLVTSSSAVAMARLVELVAAHESGLWASTVPVRYRAIYNENLPTNWQDLVESSTKFKTDRGVNGQLMILPNNDVMGSRLVAPLGGVDAGPVMTLPELKLPDQAGWNVFVTTVNSTVEVWLRLIGDDYSNKYDVLRSEMGLYYDRTYTVLTKVEINAWYAVQLEEGWHRALVEEVLDEERVLVFLGDHGDDEVVPISSLRMLAPSFAMLPPQAIFCRLDKMEELGSCEMGADIVREHLLGQVLVALPAPPALNSDNCISVILFRTVGAEDVNVNEEILKDFCRLGELSLTEKSGGAQKLCEVEVGCVSAEGQVWLVNPVGARIVREALALLTAPGPYHRILPVPSATDVPQSNKLYVVQTLNGEWLRCVVRTGLAADGTVSTRLVDSGQTMRAPHASLIPLLNYSRILAIFPHQAKPVRLGSAERAAPSMVERLRELLLEQSVLCRTLPSPHSPHRPVEPNVDLFVRQQGILASVNSTILFEFENMKIENKPKGEPKSNHLQALSRKKERIFSRTVSGARLSDPQPGSQLSPVMLPNIKEWVNVMVTMAANPCNFVVQLTRILDQQQLSELMEELQEQCPRLTAADSPASPAPGELYAVYLEKDQYWYRVVVANVVSQDMVSVYYCDFGDLALVSAAQLRRIPDSIVLARSLPPQAIKAKLYGVAPLHQDWSVEDCIRFQEMCVNREFAALVHEISTDPLNTREPLITIDLVDTSTDEDVYLNQLLEKEKRAKLTAPVRSDLS